VLDAGHNGGRKGGGDNDGATGPEGDVKKGKREQKWGVEKRTEVKSISSFCWWGGNEGEEDNTGPKRYWGEGGRPQTAQTKNQEKERHFGRWERFCKKNEVMKLSQEGRREAISLSVGDRPAGGGENRDWGMQGWKKTSE